MTPVEEKKPSRRLKISARQKVIRGSPQAVLLAKERLRPVAEQDIIDLMRIINQYDKISTFVSALDE